MKMNAQKEPLCIRPATDPTDQESDGSRVECLQREIVHLLMRNQTIRFELVVARRKLDRIETLLFGGKVDDLDQLLPPCVAKALRELFRAKSMDPNLQCSQRSSGDEPLMSQLKTKVVNNTLVE